MKSLFLAVAMVSAPAFASGMVDGTYKGLAQWKNSDTGTGTYSVTTAVSGDTVNSTYSFSGETKSWNFSAKAGTNGLFDVVSAGQKVGEGYCFDVQCHYTAFNGALEETLTFYQTKLYKLGSKTENGIKIIWQENLSKTAN